MTAAERPRSSRLWYFLLAGLLLAAGVGAYFLAFPGGAERQPDFTLAVSANGRGIGKMEQFQYAAAATEFEEALRLAPDWLPAKVNRGIALFNQNTPETIAEGRKVFADLCAADPNNRHALYCLGIIDANDGRMAEAHASFAALNKLDPDDPHTWYRLGMTHPAGVRSPEAAACFEQALKRNPNLNAARYALFLELQATDPKRAAALEAEWRALNAANWSAETDIRYGVMGKYADVIGRDAKSTGKVVVGPLPLFPLATPTVLTLAPGTKWVTAADLDPLRGAARARFGGAVVLFDFNADGKPDLFLVAAVVQDGRVRDLLLRNDGNGTFTDVTAAAGLAAPRPSLGAAAADFDNDGFPDLLVTGAGEQHLFRNTMKGTFENVSAAVGLDKLKGTCLGAGWLDIDQDSDLDLVLCQYSEGVVANFAGPPTGGQLLLWENVGVAPPLVPNGPTALSTAFRKGEQLTSVVPACPAVGVILSDLDADRDVDLLFLADSTDPVAIENDRLLRFNRRPPKWASGQPHKWNGGLVLDANHDERSDLFLVRSGGPPVFLLSSGERDFVPGVTNSPPLLHAVAADIDSDGWSDVVGLGADGKPVLLHNQGDGRLVHVPDAFGAQPACVAAAVADLTGDGLPDLLLWDEKGVRVLRNAGNGNTSLLISPTGKRDKSVDMRTNSDGIGTWLGAQAGTVWCGAERTTVSAGLGQSLLPTQLGIGKNSKAEVLRLRWPDAVIQAELGLAAGPVTVAETQRKATSCPVLLTWDGERFAFVTDFLGGGALGESGPDGSVRPPRPQESVKIEPGQLKLKDGHYVLKIAEPMDEVLYLDHLRLDVIDHPPATQAYPDERFVFAPPEASQKLFAFPTRHPPNAATDHKGRDVLSQLRERDRRAVDGFARRAWLGYAEDHSLTLDFGELPASGNWYIVLAGWTEYPYPESMIAATRAGVAIRPPVLEGQGAGGKWEPVCDLGFPAGLPRVMTRELPKDFRGGKLRITTNMQVYWDQVFVARAEDVSPVTSFTVTDAKLAARGFIQEVYPDGRPPVAYDDAKTEPVPTNAWKGFLTKLGDVTDLLRAEDDRFVLCGPGDEITVRFDAAKLPALKPGWVRSFVLRTRGYCKDTSPTTVSGREVGPLPFRAMPNYPDFGGVKPPATDADQWHTRPAGR